MTSLRAECADVSNADTGRAEIVLSDSGVYKQYDQLYIMLLVREIQ